jgi:excisionase family DNA binding protein
MNRFYTEKELAKYLCISTKTLEKMRRDGSGPRYCKIGRCVRYSYEHVESYLMDNEYIATAQYPAEFRNV